MIRLTLYSRPGCHLCEEMKAVIERVRVSIPLELVEVDVSRDADLEARYGTEIPVLEIGNRKVAKYRISEETLARIVGSR